MPRSIGSINTPSFHNLLATRNQLLVEQAVLNEMNLQQPEQSHLLDMGCGRGRIAHYFATMTGGQVSGYNIDPNQIENAIDWATESKMTDRLHFKEGNHHDPLA
jgi:sterol 24-C-methyltransferase